VSELEIFIFILYVSLNIETLAKLPVTKKVMRTWLKRYSSRWTPLVKGIGAFFFVLILTLAIITALYGDGEDVVMCKFLFNFFLWLELIVFHFFYVSTWKEFRSLLLKSMTETKSLLSESKEKSPIQLFLDRGDSVNRYVWAIIVLANIFYFSTLLVLGQDLRSGEKPAERVPEVFDYQEYIGAFTMSVIAIFSTVCLLSLLPSQAPGTGPGPDRSIYSSAVSHKSTHPQSEGSVATASTVSSSPRSSASSPTARPSVGIESARHTEMATGGVSTTVESSVMSDGGSGQV
jgi:hypothetical protein